MRSVAGVIVVAVLCLSAQAGPLATDPLAYNDGTVTWHGTQEFQIGNLHAFVDYCVYPPGAFPYPDYAGGLGEFVYAYQVRSVGQAPVTSMSIKMLDSNEAQNIGTFTLPGVAPDEYGFDFPPPNVGQATWIYYTGVNTGQDSIGMVYSSVNVPLWNDGTVQDGGAGGYVQPLPSPADYIPEPATLTLLASAGCLMLRRSRK